MADRALIAELDSDTRVVLTTVRDVVDYGKDFQAYDPPLHNWSDDDWGRIASQQDLMAVALERFGSIIDAFFIFRIERKHIDVILLCSRGSADLSAAVEQLIPVAAQYLSTDPWPRPVNIFIEAGSQMTAIVERHGFVASGEPTLGRRRLDLRKPALVRPAQLHALEVVEGSTQSATLGGTTLRVQPKESMAAKAVDFERIFGDEAPERVYLFRPAQFELRDPNPQGWRFEDEPELLLQRYVFTPPVAAGAQEAAAAVASSSSEVTT